MSSGPSAAATAAADASNPWRVHADGCYARAHKEAVLDEKTKTALESTGFGVAIYGDAGSGEMTVFATTSDQFFLSEESRKRINYYFKRVKDDEGLGTSSLKLENGTKLMFLAFHDDEVDTCSWRSGANLTITGAISDKSVVFVYTWSSEPAFVSTELAKAAVPYMKSIGY